VVQGPFVKQYTFRIDPKTTTTKEEEHVLMTTTSTQKEIPAKAAALTNINMEDKSQETTATNKTTGSPRANSPGSNKPAAARQLEDIWKKEPSSGSPERRRNGIYSSQFNELC